MGNQEVNGTVIDILVSARIELQIDQDNEKADEIEKYLNDHNITLKDTKDGTYWKRVK